MPNLKLIKKIRCGNKNSFSFSLPTPALLCRGPGCPTVNQHLAVRIQSAAAADRDGNVLWLSKSYLSVLFSEM